MDKRLFESQKNWWEEYPGTLEVSIAPESLFVTGSLLGVVDFEAAVALYS